MENMRLSHLFNETQVMKDLLLTDVFIDQKLWEFDAFNAPEAKEVKFFSPLLLITDGKLVKKMLYWFWYLTNLLMHL